MNLRHTSLLCLTLALCAALQSAPLPPPPEFRITTLDKRVRNVYYAEQGSQQRNLRLVPGFIAGPYPFAASRTLNIYQRSDSGLSALIASTSIPSSVSEPLLIVHQPPTGQTATANNDAPACSVIVLDNSARSAPVNSLRFLNLSDYTAAVSFAKSQVKTISPKGQLTFPFDPPVAGNSYRNLNIALQSPSGEWLHLSKDFDNEIYLKANCRILVIIRNPAAAIEKGKEIPPAVLILQDNKPPSVWQ